MDDDLLWWWRRSLFKKSIKSFHWRHLESIEASNFLPRYHNLLKILIFLKMNKPRPLLSFIFGLFKQTVPQFYNKYHVKKCPFSIQCQDLNPWLLEHESPPITTRPGLPPIKFDIFATIDVELRLTIFNKGPNWYLAFSSPVSKLAILPTNMPMLVQQILNQTFVYSCQKVFLFL